MRLKVDRQFIKRVILLEAILACLELAHLANPGLLYSQPRAAAAPLIEDSAELVYPDQYVLTVSSLPALKIKARDVLQDVSAKPLEITESSARAVLIEARNSSQLTARAKQAVPYRRSRDLCRKLKAEYRSNLRLQRDSGRAEIVRRISCAPNAELSVLLTPNDPTYPQLWGFSQSSDIDINMPEAWNITTGHSDVVVAVIDTGVDYNHVDLRDNIWTNLQEVPGNGVDDDGNGVVDDVHGYNAITGSGDPMDDHGHGTHCSGTIGATGNNGIGVAGVNWDVQIMGVKFLSKSGSGSLYDAMKAVDYVTTMRNRGVNVILSSNSWGGGGYYQPLYDAINRARTAGLLFVAAAGNASNNNDASPAYPSGYNLDNIIAVSAVDSNGQMAGFSSYGATSVDVGAPGVSIASTYPGNAYYYMSGTSMATPHVSGVLALLKAYVWQLDWRQLRDTLYASVKPMSSLSGKVATGGMINAYNMLRAAVTPTPGPPTATPTITPTPLPPTATPTPLPTATATPTPVPGFWPVTGFARVNGAGLVGVSASLTSAHNSVTSYSGPNGDFRFENIQGPGAYTVHCSKSGYTFADVSGYLPASPAVVCTGQARAFTLTALVLGPSGSALAGAYVDAGAFGSGVTDSNGYVSFAATYNAAYSLRVSANDFYFEKEVAEGTIYGDVVRVFAAGTFGE